MYKCCKGKIYDHNNLMEKYYHVNVKGQNDKKTHHEHMTIQVNIIEKSIAIDPTHNLSCIYKIYSLQFIPYSLQ
jgi:hypothetical protein